MAQRGKAGKSLVQVGRDYIRSFFSINISTQGRYTFPLAPVFEWIYTFFHKDQVIKDLRNQLYKVKSKLDNLEVDLSRKREEVDNVRRKIEKITQRRLAKDEGNEDLLEIAHLIARLSEENQEGRAYENARLWMQPRLRKWVEESANFVISDLIEDIQGESFERFREDLFSYMEWFQKSMEYAGPLRNDLEELNRKRSIKQPQPYRKAIQKISLEVSSGDVDEEEYLAIDKMFRFLNRNL